MLALLDRAYDAAEQPDSFDALFVAADQFFFPLSAEAGLAADIIDAGGITDGVESHVARMQGMIDRAEVGMSGARRVSGGLQVCSMVVSADGAVVVGNGAAAGLVGCGFPASVDMLALTPSSRQAIVTCLSDLRAGRLEGSSVIVIQREGEDRPYVAKCLKLQSRGPDGTLQQGLGITINHVDWHGSALNYAARTFGLTPAEESLLLCLLEGLSYPQAALRLTKSRETVKAQGKSILRKIGSKSVADVVLLMTGYAFLAEPLHGNTPKSGSPSRAPLARGPVTERMLPGEAGRQIAVQRFGLPGGRPILFFHGLYQGPFITTAMDDRFHRLGYEVIAPSRPGFGRTDPPRRWDAFNDTTTRDVEAVVSHLQLGRLDFLVHQAGISFACRAAAALEGRVGSAVMVSAGVPIKDHMLHTMNVEARVAGAAAKYAPMLFDMILRLGMAKWRRQGTYAYLSNLFADGTPDRDTLNDPYAGPVMERGVLHMISQGPKAIAADGASAMSDWAPLYPFLPKRQLWLHGAQDPVMNPRFVQEFLAGQQQPPAIVYPDRGGDVLLGASLDIMRRLHDFLAG